MFVSDILEPLLDASEIRGVVRSVCLRSLERLPHRVGVRIRPLAEFIGGKGMAYPAVWIVRELTGVPLPILRQALNQAPLSVAVALSASISDDLADGDQQTGSGHLALLYMLILQALDAGGWRSPEYGEAVHRWFSELVDDFLGECDQASNGPCSFERGAHERRGRRIAHFHRMIACELLLELDVPSDLVASGTEIAGRFGVWCADLDDILDAEIDLGRGEFANVTLTLLIELWPDMTNAVWEGSPAVLGHLASPELASRLVTHMLDGVTAIADSCRAERANGLVAHLDRLAATLPKRIPELRQAASAEFMAGRSDGSPRLP